LKPMIAMMRYIEDSNAGTLLQVLPLSTSIIPLHFLMDSESLIDLLHEEGKGAAKKKLSNDDGKTAVWKMFFNVDKIKKRGYTFNHQVKIDGVSVSISMKRVTLDANGVPVPQQRRSYNVKRKKIEDVKSERLVDLTEEERIALLKSIEIRFRLFEGNALKLFEGNALENRGTNKLNIIAVDPGKSDIWYCVDNPRAGDLETEQKSFRLTQDTRRKTLRTKKRRRKLQRLKNQVIVDNLTVEDLETIFGQQHSAKTTNVDAFQSYILAKDVLNTQLGPAFYHRTMHRNMKFGGYVREQIADARMLNSFKKTYPSAPTNTLILVGNWNEGNTMKYQESTKGKGLRSLFRQAGYNVKTVDEFRTSCRCSFCQVDQGVCATFRSVDNPRKWRRAVQPKVIRHGLTRCSLCQRLWNRDNNGASNMWRVGHAFMTGQNRPAYLCREL